MLDGNDPFVLCHVLCGDMKRLQMTPHNETQNNNTARVEITSVP
jgi:hypothetical protein